MGDKSQQKIKEIGVLAIDLATDYTQLCYMAKDMDDPKSISTIPGENKYLIPTIMYKMPNAEDWYIGDEAQHRFSEHGDEKYVITDLLQRVVSGSGSGESMYLEDVKYTVTGLLKIYFEKLFAKAQQLENISRPKNIAVTIEVCEKVLIDAIYKALHELGYNDDNITVLGHTESFIYYVINQKKDIWANDVALFDFKNEYFSYRKISISRNTTPNVITVREVDYSEELDMRYLEKEKYKRMADEKLLEIIKKEFSKQIISTVFLTGIGFYSDFAENSMVELCSKRRVFKGYNLFVKGACYGAWEKYIGKPKKEFIFQCVGRTKVNVGLMISNQGKNSAITLSQAGTNWYEAGAKAECLLDGIKSFQLVFVSPYDGCTRHVKVDLSDFPDRPNKTTRISISLAFVNDNKCEVVVTDLGFGEFFKATGMTVKETIFIDDVMM